MLRTVHFKIYGPTSESNILKSIYNKMILIMKIWSTTGTRDRDGGTGTTTRLQHGLQAPERDISIIVVAGRPGLSSAPDTGVLLISRVASAFNPSLQSVHTLNK
jgi:hypothetical protein